MSIGRHVWKLLGYAAALPTPFDENDAINAAAFEHFCERSGFPIRLRS
jgi:hypothetical protein